MTASRLLHCAVPSATDWTLDWTGLDDSFDWIRAMRSCPQDPVYHAEGDVWIHTRMVCESLVGLEAWRSLDAADRDLLFATALLHDVAKPLCTRMDNGRITSRGHSLRGAIEARRILWEADADIVQREQLCAMIRYHQVPFYLIERADADITARRISQQTRCDLLTILATADALGRICADRQDLLVRIGLFGEHCRELNCANAPWEFAGPLSRFEYFRTAGRDPHYRVHEDDTASEVILMSGLPGSGKDTWLLEQAGGLPVISLDGIRTELDVEPTENQGVVIQAARERARAYLRTGTSFAWNATNLTRDIRGPLIDLFTSYEARTRIVHVEAPYASIFTRSADRGKPVSQAVIERMLQRWDVPDVTEAPTVEWWRNDRTLERRYPGLQ